MNKKSKPASRRKKINDNEIIRCLNEMFTKGLSIREISKDIKEIIQFSYNPQYYLYEVLPERIALRAIPKELKEEIKRVLDTKECLSKIFPSGLPVRRVSTYIQKKLLDYYYPEYIIYYTGRLNRFKCSEEIVNIIRRNAKKFDIQIFLDFDGEFLVEGKNSRIVGKVRRGLRCFLSHVGRAIEFGSLRLIVWKEPSSGSEDILRSNIYTLKHDLIKKTNGILKKYIEILEEEHFYFIKHGFTFCLIDLADWLADNLVYG